MIAMMGKQIKQNMENNMETGIVGKYIGTVECREE